MQTDSYKKSQSASFICSVTTKFVSTPFDLIEKMTTKLITNIFIIFVIARETEGKSLF